jgi:hypothetical protein
MIPTIPFGAHRVTRLISGANPLVGYSHWSARRSREMEDHHVAQPANAVAYLHELVRHGINAIAARSDYHRILYWLELFRREGGQIQWIAQTASEMHDVFQNIRVIAQAGPIAIYHHGSQTDQYWRNGQIDKVKDYLKCIRDQGLMVGLAAHIPEIYDYVEGKGWDIDFYMACFYNIARQARHSELVTGCRAEASGAPGAPGTPGAADDSVPTDPEQFLPEDPARMCRFIRQTKKTCLAYKVLGAGRQCATPEQVRQAFAYAFANIKATDAVVVGMWQKYQDQINLNVEHTLAALAAAAPATATA